MWSLIFFLYICICKYCILYSSLLILWHFMLYENVLRTMWYFWFVCCLGSHISKSKSKQKIAVGCVGLNYSDNIYMHCSEIWKLGRKNAWRMQNKWLHNDNNLVWNILSFRLLDIWHQTFMQLYSSVLWLAFCRAVYWLTFTKTPWHACHNAQYFGFTSYSWVNTGSDFFLTANKSC